MYRGGVAISYQHVELAFQTVSVSGASCCENGRLEGVVAPGQPSAHAFRSQANQGPLL